VSHVSECVGAHSKVFLHQHRWMCIVAFIGTLLVCCSGTNMPAHADDGGGYTVAGVEGDADQTEVAIRVGDEIKLSRMKHIDSQPSRIVKAQPMPKVADGQLCSWRIASLTQLGGAHAETGFGKQLTSKPREGGSVWRKLQIRGTGLLSYNIRDVESSSSAGRAAFVQENYGAAKSLYHYSSITVEGPILGKLRVRAQFNTPSYSPRSNTFVLEYPMGNFLLRYGDMSLSIVGNRFASLSRWTRGFELRYSLDGKAESVYGIGQGSPKGNELVIVTAEGKSQVKRDVIQGNNTSGPFFLSSSPIVEGSEQVLVDMRQMRRGEDYQIDYDTGMLTFLGATVIPPTSTIIVTYEAAQPGEGIGRFWGARLNWHFGNRGRVGISFLTQGAAQRQSSYDGVKRREEFLGANTVGPFQLSQRPIVEGSESVTVNGVLQERNRDYIINYISGLITFVRPVPVGAIIAVEYLQRASHGAVIGQHSVIGLDADISFGRLGEVNLQLAQSNGPARNGTAIEIASRLSFGRLKAHGEQKGVSESAQRGEQSSTRLQLPEAGAQVGEFKSGSADEAGDNTLSGNRANNAEWVRGGEDLRQSPSGGNVSSVDERAFEHSSASPSRITVLQPQRTLIERQQWSTWQGELSEPYRGMQVGGARTELTLRLLKVTPGFARIENADFYQNESGFEASLVHRFTPHIAFTSHWVSASTSYLTSAFGMSSSPTSSKRFSAALSFDKPNLPTLRLAHQRFSFGSKGSSNEYASTSALISYRRRRWSIDAAYEDNSQSFVNTISSSAGDKAASQGYGSSGRTRTTLCRLSFKYEPSERLFLSADWSSNRSTSGSRSISASNLQLGTSFQASRSLRLSFSHNILTGSGSAGIGSFIIGGAAGAYSGLPYTFGAYDIGAVQYGGMMTGLGGYGTFGAAQRPITGLGGMSAIGYHSGAIGGSPGYGSEWRKRQTEGGSTLTAARNKSVATVASLDWQPSSRLSFLCQFSRQLTYGSSFIADYSSTDWGMQLGYQLSRKLTLTGQFSRQMQSFLQPSSEAFTSIYGVGMHYAGNKLNASLYWNVLSSESTQQFFGGATEQVGGQFNNAFKSLTLDATYRLSKRLELMGTFVHARNRGIGGYAQNSFRAAVGYRIFEHLWLDINMERIDRKDLVGTGSDYKATIVSFQLRGTF